MTGIEDFHFLRPLWLLLLLPMAALFIGIWRAQDAERAWRQILPPHLLEHLLVGTDVRRGAWRPVVTLAILWLVGALALAGPSWTRVPAPFGEENSAQVIVIKVTPSMLARDIQPSRLERGLHKLHDLLELRPGTRTGLVAYSGSAHVVMPLTSDARIIEQFAAELSPDILPREGDAAADAIALAKSMLGESGLAGSIILFADEVAADQVNRIGQQHAAGDPVTNILALAAGPGEPVPLDGPPAAALDADAMERAANSAGGSLVRLTADNGDVTRLARLAESSVSTVSSGEGETWEDAGYYLLPVLALVLLLGFRPGWMVRYQ